MVKNADILVIGGGMAGISAAAEMSAGERVVVLEAESNIGYHSTGRSAAIFIRNYGNETLRALNAASEPYLRDQSLLSPRGELLLAGADEVEVLEDYLTGADGMERLTAQQAVEMVPILRPELIAMAAYEPTVCNIDVDRMLQEYVRKLRQNGGQIITNSRIVRMVRDAGEWQVTNEDGETFSAPVVVNAAGAWADKMAGIAGVAPVGLTPMRRSIAVLPAPGIDNFSQWPVFASAAEHWYAIPESGRLLFSPADKDPVEPHDVWVDDMVLAEGLHRFEQATTLAVSRVEHSWAGMRSFVADGTPVVGFAPDAPGFFWLAGQGGYGIQTAPALAKLTADLVQKRVHDLPARNMVALSPGRFG